MKVILGEKQRLFILEILGSNLTVSYDNLYELQKNKDEYSPKVYRYNLRETKKSIKRYEKILEKFRS